MQGYIIMTELNPDTHILLQERLKKAEALAREVVQQTDDQHPLTEATRELLDVHAEIRRLLLSGIDPGGNRRAPSDGLEVESAAIEIHREEHELKADVVDIIKALFMWKDDPVDRASNRD